MSDTADRHTSGYLAPTIHGVELNGTLAEPFRTRLRVSLEAGILLGVKYGAALILVGLALGFLLGDYATTKSHAANGQQAYEALVRAQQAQQAKQQAVKP